MTTAPCAAPPQPTQTPLVSASQITLFGECQRKWAWKYIANIETPQNASAALGTEVDDHQLQPYLRDGREFDYTRESGSGYIAAAGLACLPRPQAPGLEVQKHFVMPAATARRADGAALFGYQGYLDLWLPERGLPDVPPCTDHEDCREHPELGAACIASAPIVVDFKTTSDLKWAKTPAQLAVDVQAQLYATWAMFETGARMVDLVWIYFQTRGARKVKRVHLRVHGDDVAERFLEIERTAVDMFEARQATTDPASLPPNPAMCEAYGGCPYRSRCNLGPTEIVDSFAAQAARKGKGESMSTTANLFAQLAAKVGNPAPAAPPAPEQVPAALLKPYVPKSPEGAIAVGLPPSAAVGYVPPAPLGINPPESTLAPAPPVGVSAPTAPLATVEPKRPPGRPRKQLAETPDVPEAVLEETVTVAWAEERFSPVSYQSFGVGPFEITSKVRPGETTAAAILRVHAELHEAAKTLRGSKAASFAQALTEMGVGR